MTYLKLDSGSIGLWKVSQNWTDTVYLSYPIYTSGLGHGRKTEARAKARQPRGEWLGGPPDGPQVLRTLWPQLVTLRYLKLEHVGKNGPTICSTIRVHWKTFWTTMFLHQGFVKHLPYEALSARAGRAQASRGNGGRDHRVGRLSEKFGTGAFWVQQKWWLSKKKTGNSTILLPTYLLDISWHYQWLSAFSRFLDIYFILYSNF